MWIQINPGLRIVWRDARTVQIGLGTDAGIILDHLRSADERFLDRMRNGIRASTTAAAAAECGLDEKRATQLLNLLSPVLIHRMDPPASGVEDPGRRFWSATYQCDGQRLLDRRSHRVVHAVGLGRAGITALSALASSGVGTFLVQDLRPVRSADAGAGGYPASSVGRVRAHAARELILEINPKATVLVQTNLIIDRSVDLSICVEKFSLPNVYGARMLQRTVTHLPLVLRENDAVLGPLVVPGVTACTHCVELHRRDGDPGWRFVAEQLGSSSMEMNHLSNYYTEEESAVSGMAGGLAAVHGLLQLDGMHRPSSWSASLELDATDGSVTSTPWIPHPKCGCRGIERGVHGVALRRYSPDATYSPETMSKIA